MFSCYGSLMVAMEIGSWYLIAIVTVTAVAREISIMVAMAK